MSKDLQSKQKNKYLSKQGHTTSQGQLLLSVDQFHRIALAKIDHDEIEREVPTQLEYHRGRYVKPVTGAPFQVRFAQQFPSLPYCRRASHPSTTR